jgi:hypothetical protein
MKIAHAGAAFALALTIAPANAQNVKITPVGSHPGELCANDRAAIFEDPTGVRIFYDVRARAKAAPACAIFMFCSSG